MRVNPYLGTLLMGHAAIVVPANAMDALRSAAYEASKLTGAAIQLCDGQADESELNDSITEAALRGHSGNLGADVLWLPGKYTLAGEVLVNKNRTTVRGLGGRATNTTSLDATALGTTDACIRVSADGCTLEGVDLTGDTGAGYGLLADGTASGGINTLTVRSCQIHNFKDYGIWLDNGVWSVLVDDCGLHNSGVAQIYSVRDVDGQNGNALSIEGRTTFKGLSGAATGITWAAANLSILGANFESCSIGVDAVSVDASYFARGVGILCSYFEASKYCDIRIGDTGASVAADNRGGARVDGLLIGGNYVSPSDIATYRAHINLRFAGCGLITASSVSGATLSTSTASYILTDFADDDLVITGHTEFSGSGTASSYSDAMVLRRSFQTAEQGSAPPTPAANHGVMYFRDNGAGKTQLVALFPTGAVQVIATEP